MGSDDASKGDMDDVRKNSEHPQAGSGSSSRERDLILGAFADLGSAGGSAGGGAVGRSGRSAGLGLGSGSRPSDPEAPTSVGGPGVHGGAADPFEVDAVRDVFDGYEIVREIHRGGQGVVYQAVQESTKQKVAIKVMHGGATLGAAGRARFEREVQVLGQLNHPNIVKLHDSGVTSDGSFFCVMDYIAGRALDQVLSEQRKTRREAERDLARSGKRSRSGVPVGPGVRDTLKLFAKICEAVNAAHLRGVIHRDIKPANIRVDHNGEPIVVDFGLAKTVAGMDDDGTGKAMTMTGQFVGSLPWASPEQADGTGGGVDVRSDVYSLGVVLYQLLTGGTFPYSVVGNMRDVLDNIQRAEPTRPSTVRKQINDEVETIVLKTLAKDRERRYQSAGELARDIERYLAGEPIEAKRDSGWYLIQKTVTRHKAPAAFAASAALMLVAFGGVMTGAYQKTEAALVSETAERERAQDNLRAVLDMAGTLVYDFHDAIANLRGATEARELVLTSAIDQLQRVEAQANNDPAFLRQLAEAHERVGDLQGGLYGASTGSTASAAEHYDASLDIRLALYAGALETNQGLAEMSRLMSDSYRRRGDVLRKRGDYAGAIGAYREGERYAVEGDDVSRHLSVTLARVDVEREAARRGDSLAAIEESLDGVEGEYRALQREWGKVTSDEAEHAEALILGKLAMVSMLRGESRLALAGEVAPAENDAGAAFREATQRSVWAKEAFETRAQEAPEEYKRARDLWVCTHDAGTAVWGASKQARARGENELADELLGEARRGFAQCVALAEAMAGDESNLEAQRDLATALNKMGNVMRDAGELDEARAVFARSDEIRAKVRRSDPVVRHLRDLGVGEYKLAQVDELRADRAASDGERRALLELARGGYRRAMETFGEYEERSGAGSALSDEVRGDLDRVRKALGG